jgi:hypothetical protein
LGLWIAVGGAYRTRHTDSRVALANLREALELYFEDSPVPDVDVSPELASVDVRLPACPSSRSSRSILLQAGMTADELHLLP